MVMDKSNRCLLRVFCCFTILISLLLLQFRFANVYGETATSIQSKDEILHLEEEILNMSHNGDERIEAINFDPVAPTCSFCCPPVRTTTPVRRTSRPRCPSPAHWPWTRSRTGARSASSPRSVPCPPPPPCGCWTRPAC